MVCSFMLPLLLNFAAGPATAASADVDVLRESMLGEFALQAGDIPGASTHYAAAAQQSTRTELIERAATVALYAKDYPAAERVGQHWLRTDPASVGARRALAWAALATGQADAALQQVESLLTGQTLEGQRAVAQVLVAAENRAGAPALLRVLVDRNLLVAIADGPNWSAVAGNLKENDAAAALADALTRANPKDAEAWRRSAQAHLARADKDAAQRALEKAVSLAPDDFDLRLALASLLSASDRQDAADRVLADAPTQDDRTYAARLANVAVKPQARLLKRIARALERSTLESVPTRAFLLGQLAELRKQPDAALEWYAQEPKGAAWNDAQLRRAVLLARDKQDIAGARALLKDVRGGNDDDQADVDAYLLEAELLLPADRAGAAAVYDEAIARHPQDVRLLYARGLFRAEADDVAGLEQDLRNILAVDPDNPQALNALGYTLADRTDRHAEALGYIQRALASNPDDGAFIDSMGWVQYRLGNLTQAEEFLRRAYALVADGEVAAHLAEVLWAAGNHVEAEQIWRDALTRWPESKPLKDSVQRLNPGLLP